MLNLASNSTAVAAGTARPIHAGGGALASRAAAPRCARRGGGGGRGGVAAAPSLAPSHQNQRGAGVAARAGWDFGRFAKTVLYFNDPFKALAGLLGGGGGGDQQSGVGGDVETLVRGPPAPGDAASRRDGVVMVTGATGGVGKRVVQMLLARGRRVRALVRDVPKARELLGSLTAAPGGVLEVVAADLTQKRTLQPGMFEGVRELVSCSAVKVQPKEGDTADRAKYMQGIKFYDPEIVGDTPESVEKIGIENLLANVGSRLGFEKGTPLLQPTAEFAARWGALDDVVMGGVSESGLALVQGAGENGGAALVFRGVVSTENRGGFASVRCRNFEPALDLGAYGGLRLRLKGNGLRYKAILRTDSGWDGIGYTRSFDTKAGEWQTIDLPFEEFVPVFRARTVTGADAKPVDPSTVYSLQIMLSKFEYDGRLNPSFATGPFELPIAEITTYLKDPVVPRIVHVSSAGVTRPNRPGIDVEQEPPAVKLNDALGGLLTYKLAGEDVIRASGVPATVVRPTALTEEAGRMPVEIDQGDVIKGKISRNDVAELCVELLSIPSASGTTFEIKSTVPFSQPWTGEDEAKQPARDWKQTFESAKVVPGVTGKTVGGVYTGKQPEASFAAKATVAV